MEVALRGRYEKTVGVMPMVFVQGHEEVAMRKSHVGGHEPRCEAVFVEATVIACGRRAEARFGGTARHMARSAMTVRNRREDSV